MANPEVARLLKKALEEIKQAAKDAGMHPSMLTKAQYYNSGGTISPWDLRKLGGFQAVLKAHFETSAGKDLGLITDLKEIRKEHNRLERELGNQEAFFKRLQDCVSNIPRIRPKPYRVLKARDDEERTLNLVLSDLHIGSDLTIEEHGHRFGVVEEARALAQVTENVIEYKRQYRDNTKLVINILGDVIENMLHGFAGAAPLHVQTCRAIWLIQQVIARAAEHFKQVDVNLVPGNHGRDTAIHPQRATSQKFNALETTIYYAVRTALQNVPNVRFHQPMTAWISYRAQGHMIYATHGDTHLNPGNPGKSVNIGSLENQINKINASLKDSTEYKAFICGHVHLPLVTQLPNSTYMIINGALVLPNGFAQNLGIMESQQVQVMFESTAKHAVGDFRFINVGKSAERRDLDKLVQPFPGL